MYTSIHNLLVIVSSDIPKVTLGEYCPMRSQKKSDITPLSSGKNRKVLGFVHTYVRNRKQSNTESSGNEYGFDPKDNRVPVV